MLGTAWTLPFGLGADIAGWLVDRWGAKRVLVLYLIGCGILSAGVAMSTTYGSILVAMFLMFAKAN